MKIYLMTDMEGVAGIVNHDDWVMPDGRNYTAGLKLLTGEVNAAVDGFFAAGATEIWVIDGHGAGGIDPLALDPRAQYVRTTVGPYPFLLDETFDCVAWVGQHAKAGTKYAHIAHTGWFDVLDFQLNGRSVGEFGVHAYLAASFGVAPVFASGDAALAIEAKALIPGIETVTVKWGLTPDDGAGCDMDEYRRHNLSARHLSPEFARRQIRAGAEQALRRFREDPQAFRLPPLQPPLRQVIHYRKAGDRPARTVTREHPSDLVTLLNMPASG